MRAAPIQNLVPGFQRTIEDALHCQAFQAVITFVDMRGLGSTVDDVSDSWEELVTEVMSFSYVSLVLHYASFCGDERKSNFKNTIKIFSQKSRLLVCKD